MTRKFLHEYVEAEQEAQLAIKEKETKTVMTDYDRFMEFLKHVKVEYKVIINADAENTWQKINFIDDQKRNLRFVFDTFGALIFINTNENMEDVGSINVAYDVPRDLDVDSAKWNTLKNLQPPIDD